MAGLAGAVVGCAKRETSVLRISMIIDLILSLEGEGAVSDARILCALGSGQLWEKCPGHPQL